MYVKPDRGLGDYAWAGGKVGVVICGTKPPNPKNSLGSYVSSLFRGACDKHHSHNVSIDRPDVLGGYVYAYISEDLLLPHTCNEFCPEHTCRLGSWTG